MNWYDHKIYILLEPSEEVKYLLGTRGDESCTVSGGLQGEHPRRGNGSSNVLLRPQQDVMWGWGLPSCSGPGLRLGKSVLRCGGSMTPPAPAGPVWDSCCFSAKNCFSLKTTTFVSAACPLEFFSSSCGDFLFFLCLRPLDLVDSLDSLVLISWKIQTHVILFEIGQLEAAAG